MTYPILLALGVLDAAGYSVIAPVLPEIAQSTSGSTATMGALVAMFPLGMVLGFALAGAAVKRHGPKPVIALSLLIVGIASLGFAIAGGLASFFAARLAMGLGSGGLWIGITFATLEHWPGQEYLCMGRIFAAYSAGGLVGPLLGAINGIAGPFAVYAALAGAALAAVLLLMTPPAVPRAFDTDRSALLAPGFWIASSAILFTVLGLGVVEGVLPLHLAGQLDQAEIGLLYAGVSLLVVASAAIAVRFTPRVDVVAAALLIPGGLAIAGATDTIVAWAAALVLAGIGIGLGNTGSIGILLDSVEPERIVTAMIIWSQIGIAGYLLGPLTAGAVVESTGFAALGIVPVIAAVLLLGAMRKVACSRPAASKSVGG